MTLKHYIKLKRNRLIGFEDAYRRTHGLMSLMSFQDWEHAYSLFDFEQLLDRSNHLEAERIRHSHE